MPTKEQQKPNTETKERPQSLTGLIRSRLSEYEERQFAGVSQKVFAEELTASGFPINYKTFRNLLARAKKQVNNPILKTKKEKQEIKIEKIKEENEVIEQTKKQIKIIDIKKNETGFNYKGTAHVTENDFI